MNKNIIPSAVAFLVLIGIFLLFYKSTTKNADNFKTYEAFRIMSLEDYEYMKTKLRMRFEDSINYTKYFDNISHFSNREAIYYSQWLPSYNNYYLFNVGSKNRIKDEKVLMMTYQMTSENQSTVLEDTLLILLAKLDFEIDTYWIPVGVYNYSEYGNYISTEIEANWRIEYAEDTSLVSTIQIQIDPRIFYHENGFGYTRFNYFFTKPKRNKDRGVPVDEIIRIHSKDGQFRLRKSRHPLKLISLFDNKVQSDEERYAFMINETLKNEPMYRERLRTQYTLGLTDDERFYVFRHINNGIRIDIE